MWAASGGGRPLRCAPVSAAFQEERVAFASTVSPVALPSEVKQVRLSHLADLGPDRPGKENPEQLLLGSSSRRFCGESGGPGGGPADPVLR